MIAESLGKVRRLLENPEIFFEIRLIKEEGRQKLVNIHSHPINDRAWLKKVTPGFQDLRFFLSATQNLSDSHTMRIEVLMERLWDGQDPILVGFVVFWVQEVNGNPEPKHVTFSVQNA